MKNLTNFLHVASHFDNLEMNFESLLGVKLEVSKLYWEIHHLGQKKILVHLTGPINLLPACKHTFYQMRKNNNTDTDWRM